jgi:restriction endonuclease S subunit
MKSKEQLLGDIAKIQRGLTFSAKDTANHSDNVVLRATNLNRESGKLDLTDLKYLKNDFRYDKKFRVTKDSILICFSSGSKSHLGKVVLVQEDIEAAFGGFIGSIQVDKKVLEPKFLYYQMRSRKYFDYIQSLTDGANINNLKMSEIKSFPILVPPINRQKEIIKQLDSLYQEIDSGVTSLRRLEKNFEELRYALIEETMTK